MILRKSLYLISNSYSFLLEPMINTLMYIYEIKSIHTCQNATYKNHSLRKTKPNI